MARWSVRIPALLAPLLAAVALLAALGVFASDVPATGERADERALAFATELRGLAGQAVEHGRAVQRGSGGREQLRGIADRAQSIEYAARQLHRSETSRDELRRAALAVAEAAAVVARWEGEADRLRRARRALRRAERALDEAAGELSDTAGEAAVAEVRAGIAPVLIAGPVRR